MKNRMDINEYVLKENCYVHKDTVAANKGKTVPTGHFNLIEEDVIIGENTIIMHNIEIRRGTKIGENCYIDSGVKISGDGVTIGNNVRLRYNAIVCRKAHIGRDSFISPNVMMIYDDKTEPIIIGRRAFIGTGTVLAAGVIIGQDVVIGAMSFVRENCIDPGVYVGNPLRKIK